MVRVWIDEEAKFEASHLLRGADGAPLCWNGWVQPVFTEKQMREVIAHGVLEGWEGCDEGWYEVDPDGWTVDGWVWDFEDEPCGFCGGEASGRVSYREESGRFSERLESLTCDECVDELREGGEAFWIEVTSL